MVVEREAFDEVLTEPFGRPAAKLDSAGGTDSLANSQNHVKTVVLDEAADCPGPSWRTIRNFRIVVCGASSPALAAVLEM